MSGQLECLSLLRPRRELHTSGSLEGLALEVTSEMKEDSGDSTSEDRVLLNDEFLFSRREKVILRVTPERLEWSSVDRLGSVEKMHHLALAEIVAVTDETVLEACCFGHVVHKLCVHSFERNKKGTPAWKPVQYKFASRNALTVRRWMHQLQELLGQFAERPKKLWVFINPFGGHAVQVCSVFELAGIASTVQVTQKANEAFDCVRTIPLAKLEALDGIVVVGGDGLFQEVMNGLLERNDGSQRALRIGHIPAGSTDAVAWSVNGTRCPVSAALRIVLGDRMPLDVMNVQSEGDRSGKYSACIAGYGFMGDIISISENLRWCGPARYDIAGVLTFITHNSHKARISYIRAQEPDEARQECRSSCLWCKNKQNLDSAQENASAVGESSLDVIEGEFVSIMISVTPCRSDKSPNGLVPYAHLSDGRIHLTLVKKCPRWRYLSFLISLSRHGIIPGKHDFVQTIDAKWARVEPVDGKSTWSIDGELSREQNVTSSAHHGLIEVFARGIEVQE